MATAPPAAAWAAPAIIVHKADNQNQGFEGGNQCGASAAGESDNGRSQRGFGRRVRQQSPGLGGAAAAEVTAAQNATLATSAATKGHARPVIADRGRRANPIRKRTAT